MHHSGFCKVLLLATLASCSAITVSCIHSKCSVSILPITTAEEAAMCTIEGRVVDEDGQPALAVSLELTSSDGKERVSQIVGIDGDFCFRLSRPGGTYRLKLDEFMKHYYYAPKCTTIQTEHGKRIKLLIKLKRNTVEMPGV